MNNNTTADTTAKGDQWALLVKGQEVLPGDQMLGADAETWITLASPEGQIFDPAKNPPVRRSIAPAACSGLNPVAWSIMEPSDEPGIDFNHEVRMRWPGEAKPDHAEPLYSQAAIDTLRAQLGAASAEVARWAFVRQQSGVSVSVEEVDGDGDCAFVSGHSPEELDAEIDRMRSL